MKTNTILRFVSLMVIGVSTVILAVTRIAGVELADIAVRGLGISELVACLILGFVTVKRIRGRGMKDSRGNDKT